MQATFLTVKIVALLSYTALAFFVIQSKAQRNARNLFVVYIGGMLFWQFTSLMVSLSTDARQALLWYNLAVAGAGTANILFYPFAKAFTSGKTKGFLTIVSYLSCALMFAAGIFGLTWNQVVMGHGGYWVPVYDTKWLLILAPIWYFFFGCGIIVLVKALFRERSPVTRNRLFYVLGGASFVVVGISTNLTPLRDYPVDITFNLASAFVIGFAVIRYKLLDIRFVLVRSLYYSVMTASLIAAYVGLIFGLERVLLHGLTSSNANYGIAAVLILAFLFLPIRNALQAIIDKVFFREKENYQKETQAFSRSVASLYGEDDILALTRQSVSKTVRTTFIAILLYDPSSGRYVQRTRTGRETEGTVNLEEAEDTTLTRWLRRQGQPIVREESILDPDMRQLVEGNSSILASKDAAITVPILLDKRLFGMIVLGQKLSGLMFNGEDLSFLSTIANQAATALDKSEIFRKIQRRLSEQTLLFVLSEKFRSTPDFDAIMNSVVSVLGTFLNCEHCALVSFDKTHAPRTCASDRLAETAAVLALRAWTELSASVPGRAFDPCRVAQKVGDLTRLRDDLEASEKEAIASLIYRPLSDGDNILGFLAISDRSGGPAGLAKENELLLTIQAIISQGLVLHRTIIDLRNLEAYNERILDSLNDMSDTLMILGEDGVVRSVNKALCRLLGFEERELIGRPVSMIVEDDEGVLTLSGLKEIARSQPVSNRELSYRTASGVKIPMLFSCSSIAMEGSGDKGIIGIARDMTERLKAEDAAKNLLLVQEIHHRIKNNLQVISSLLSLQAGYVDDEKVKEMFRESQNRVRSMALIHEKLYGSGNASTMDFAGYVEDLARSLMASYSLHPSKIRLDVDVSDVRLDLDAAGPCSLIINELVSNAFKHAFPDGRPGRILVKMRMIEPPANGDEKTDIPWRYELIVEDDGIGLPPNIDFRASRSLGFRIVTTLTKQLRGEIEMERGAGTRFVVRMSVSAPR